MISVTIFGVTVSGETQEQFEWALTQVANVSALAQSLGAYKPSMSQGMRPAMHDYVKQWLASKLNLRGLERFRMSNEEKATYGDDESARQESAKARLIEGGEDVSEDSETAVPMEAQEPDESLVSEF